MRRVVHASFLSAVVALGGCASRNLPPEEQGSIGVLHPFVRRPQWVQYEPCDEHPLAALFLFGLWEWASHFNPT